MLDKMSYKLLRKLYKTGYLLFAEVRKITKHKDVSCIDPVSSFLLQTNLATLHMTGEISDDGEQINDGYAITMYGRAYIEQRRHNFLMFLLPYAITTLIALASLTGTIASNWAVIQSWFQAQSSCTPIP